jgi:anti-sigma regulatory factor (Ser/Thr protein kinase)
VSEAFTNALVHGNKKDSSKTIKIILKLNQHEILADIIDEGQGGLGRVHSRNPIGLLDETGRGIDLIKHFATVAKFKEDETGGLVVTIKLEREGE